MNQEKRLTETNRTRSAKYPTLKSLVGAAGKLPKRVDGDVVEIARQERAVRRRK
jgi:hypothetical protein